MLLYYLWGPHNYGETIMLKNEDKEVLSKFFPSKLDSYNFQPKYILIW